MNGEVQIDLCFGKGTETENCAACAYAEACRFAFQDQKKTTAEDSRWSGNTQFMENSAKHNRQPLPVDLSDDRKMYSRDEVVALSAFLLRVGRDRKLGKILTEKLTGAKSFAEIARREGVTRQAIHKRVGKQLAKLLGYKERQLTDSRLLSLDLDEFRILKLSRSGCMDDEIEDFLSLPHSEYQRLKKRLEWKLMHWT